MFDTLQLIVWSFTYCLIMVSCFKHFKDRKPFFPAFAGAPTLAWEFLALLQSKGFWGHIIWFVLDGVIFVQNTIMLGTKRKKGVYLTLLLTCSTILFFVFNSKQIDGMLISSFVIDILIASEYLIRIKKISPHLRTTIGFFRLIGDAFAWIAYARTATIILFFGGIVFVINILYVGGCLELYSHKKFYPKNP